MNNKVVITLFDFETNGTNATDSVLEVMFNKLYFNNKGVFLEKKQFHRYYLLEENEVFSFGAYSAHGLLMKDIEKIRGENCLYPETFKKDLFSIMEFLDESDILVAHNIDFDYKFLPPMPLKYKFCTMKDLKQTIGALNINGKLKNPTLVEACSFYDVDFNVDQAHGAEYDTDKLTEMFLSMLETNKELFFLKEKRPSSSKIFIRNKLGNIRKEIDEKLFEVDGFWFVLSQNVLKESTSAMQVYEKRTGNLFYVIEKMNLKTYLSDIMHSKKLESDLHHIISEMGSANLRSIIEEYTSEFGETSNRNLFD